MKSPDMFSILHSPFYIRVVRWAFDRFYREFAWSYDVVAAAVSRGRWGAWRLAALPFLSGRVLELGCGTGHVQLALAARPGYTPFGVDSSAQMVDITSRRLMSAGCVCRLVRAAAQSLPFSPAAFDSIVATFPSEYIIDPATMSEAWRVLRPGGRLVIVLAAVFDRDGIYERLIDLAFRVTLQRSPRAAARRPPHSPVGARLARAGFSIVERWEQVGGDRVHIVIGSRC